MSVVIPLFNEASTVAGVISSVLEQDCVAQIVIVDDSSTDGSHAAALAVNDPRVSSDHASMENHASRLKVGTVNSCGGTNPVPCQAGLREGFFL